MDWSWIAQECFIPTVQQGAVAIAPVILASLLIRLAVPLRLPHLILDAIAVVLGVLILWWYYEKQFIYFIVLSALIYLLLLVVPRGKRGVVVGGACVTFLVTW